MTPSFFLRVNYITNSLKVIAKPYTFFRRFSSLSNKNFTTTYP